MILSVSRRTDIPAFYSEWFFDKLKDGYVLVPNSINPSKVAKINIEPLKIKTFKPTCLERKLLKQAETWKELFFGQKIQNQCSQD